MENDKCLIGRQPILDRREQVCAYELLFRSPGALIARVFDHSRATARVILNTLAGFGIQEILGGNRGFINVEQDLLMSESLELLPREAVGIELLEGLQVTPELVERCRYLKEKGFFLILDDHQFEPRFAPLYPLIDLVKVDLFLTPVAQLPPMVHQLRAYPFKLLAEKVETRDEFRQCLELGFDFFQGFYFAKPSIMEKQRIDGSGTALLKMLHLLLEDAEIEALENCLKQCPGMTYSVLLLVNSVGMGMRSKIASVRHAINLLGRRQLKRWVQLALFASADERGLDNPMVDLAAVRGGLMEQLALIHPQTRKIPEIADQAFMAGILSLLEWIYAVNMENVVKDLSLSDEIAEALLQRSGMLGKLLVCVEAMEQMDFKGAWPQLQALGFTPDQVLEAQCKSYKWKLGMG
ncbi:EAL and HDOD domain-containing protein [Trichloromonas sp.]|uniref:EAL and HDOD domain-containing protein n=1 Tax=Trichloromonas sp. TaxID=3069249 RepID=UPI002A3E9669|nr:EAL domain-containing protein [Trichloromonas sp.]